MLNTSNRFFKTYQNVLCATGVIAALIAVMSCLGQIGRLGDW